jgi:hypothetical protein
VIAAAPHRQAVSCSCAALSDAAGFGSDQPPLFGRTPNVCSVDVDFPDRFGSKLAVNPEKPPMSPYGDAAAWFYEIRTTVLISSSKSSGGGAWESTQPRPESWPSNRFEDGLTPLPTCSSKRHECEFEFRSGMFLPPVAPGYAIVFHGFAADFGATAPCKTESIVSATKRSQGQAVVQLRRSALDQRSPRDSRKRCAAARAVHSRPAPEAVDSRIVLRRRARPRTSARHEVRSTGTLARRRPSSG